VFYYHGMTPDSRPDAAPTPIGTAKYSHTDQRGHWYRVTLNKASEYAKRIWDAAKRGIARASSGAIAHLVRKATNGEILRWPLAELSLIDAEGNRQPANQYAVAMPAAKANYQASGLEFPDFKQGAYEMEPNELETLLDKKLAEREAAQAAKAQAEAVKAQAVDDAVKAAKEKWEAEAAKNNRLPQAPAHAKFGETWKYDKYGAADLSFAAEILQRNGKPVSNALSSHFQRMASPFSQVHMVMACATLWPPLSLTDLSSTKSLTTTSVRGSTTQRVLGPTRVRCTPSGTVTNGFMT
jgi:hypothetical protein